MQTVADIMTKDVVTVTKETTVRELAQIFESRHFGSLPVVDGTGCLTGIVTASDLIEQGRSLHIPTVISLFDWVIPLQGERSLERDLQKMTAQTVGEICATDVHRGWLTSSAHRPGPRDTPTANHDAMPGSLPRMLCGRHGRQRMG